MEEKIDFLKSTIVPNLYREYSSILSLSNVPLSLLDIDGNILLELIPSPDFCTHVCHNSQGRSCNDYISKLGNSKKVQFTCKHGLENILYPVILGDEILGYIGGIQSFLDSNEYQKHLIDINSLKDNEFVDDPKRVELLAKSISAIKSIDINKIKIQEQLCAQIARNISLDLFENTNKSNQDLKRLSIEKETLEKKIIDLEAKNMSLAVNPHFLFNTLNCIARIAYFEESSKTEELIYCLSDLLRYNLKQDNQIHTLDAEINNIEKYLFIQKNRYNDRLDYDIDIHPSLLNYKIPNMVIQPLVENSLIHGIASKRDGGKVNIYANKSNNELVIYISDNGNGFPKDILLKLQDPKNDSGLGFRNTDNRLKKYYGNNYGLEIIKSDYSGSTVTITIPI